MARRTLRQAEAEIRDLRDAGEDLAHTADAKIRELERENEDLRRSIEIGQDTFYREKEKLLDEKEDIIARGITRNSDYEAKLRLLRNELNEAENIAAEHLNELANIATEELAIARSKSRYLSQVLVAIVSYGGPDTSVLRDLAAVAIRDWLPTPDESEEQG